MKILLSIIILFLSNLANAQEVYVKTIKTDCNSAGVRIETSLSNLLLITELPTEEFKFFFRTMGYEVKPGSDFCTEAYPQGKTCTLELSKCGNTFKYEWIDNSKVLSTLSELFEYLSANWPSKEVEGVKIFKIIVNDKKYLINMESETNQYGIHEYISITKFP